MANQRSAMSWMSRGTFRSAHNEDLARSGVPECRQRHVEIGSKPASPNDVLLWNNRCTLHARTDFSDKDRRLMRRVAIKGERPILGAGCFRSGRAARAEG